MFTHAASVDLFPGAIEHMGEYLTSLNITLGIICEDFSKHQDAQRNT
jgi:hypothetical protein